MKNKPIVKKWIEHLHLHLTIPILCFLFWAVFSQVNNNFIFDANDYPGYYYAWVRVLNGNVDSLYSKEYSYTYLPAFAYFFSFIAFFSYRDSMWIFYVILILFGEWAIVLQDNCLDLKLMPKKFRFLFLMVVSNGYKIIKVFDDLQAKFIVLALLLLFVKREIQFGDSRSNNLWFFFTQALIMSVIVSMLPPLVFIMPIYLFHRFYAIKIISRKMLIKFGLMGLAFILPNFIFLFYPTLIINFIVRSVGQSRPLFIDNLPLYITNEDVLNGAKLGIWVFYNIDAFSSFYCVFVNQPFPQARAISLILMGCFSLFLIARRGLNIEYKIAQYCLFSLFFNMFLLMPALIVLLPMIALQLANQIKTSSLLTRNKTIIVGLFLILIVNFIPTPYFLLTRFPALMILPFSFFLLTHSILFILIAIVLLWNNLIILTSRIKKWGSSLLFRSKYLT